MEEWILTRERLQKFREMGYKVETILECEWAGKVTATHGLLGVMQGDILHSILSGDIFGSEMQSRGTTGKD